jgi:DNA-binding transcriptional LysR family regulator
MEMHQVRYFLAVADELNFTRAAEKCNVAQPSLTRAIKLLECALGGPLFNRERANTHLTELGRMVRPHLEQVYQQSIAAQELAASFTKVERVPLRLGVMCTIAPDQLVGLIFALHSRYPGVELKLLDGTGQTLNEHLLSGELEVAIFCTGLVPPDDRLHAIPLFREQMMIVLHPDHPLAAKNMISVKDLNGQRYLQRINCEFTGQVSPIMREQNVSVEVAYQSERDDWIMSMVASGFGYGFMPLGCITNQNVVARPLIDPEIYRLVNLVTVRGRQFSPAVGALVREAMRSKWQGGPAIAVQEMDASEDLPVSSIS